MGMPVDGRPRRELVYRDHGPGAYVHCGVLAKDRPSDDLIDLCEDRYAFIWLLRGEGVYRDGDRAIPVRAGDVLQRLPGRRHSTIAGLERTWVEWFVALPPSLMRPLAAAGVLLDEPVLRPGPDRLLHCVALLVARQ